MIILIMKYIFCRRDTTTMIKAYTTSVYYQNKKMVVLYDITPFRLFEEWSSVEVNDTEPAENK